MTFKGRCSSGVEHFLGKEEVVSSILINGSLGFDLRRENASFVLPKSIPEVQECDATKADSSNAAGFINRKTIIVKTQL